MKVILETTPEGSHFPYRAIFINDGEVADVMEFAANSAGIAMVLELMDQHKGGTSFEDMQAALKVVGFKGRAG